VPTPDRLSVRITAISSIADPKFFDEPYKMEQ
jgi:hypothetical protein